MRLLWCVLIIFAAALLSRARVTLHRPSDIDEGIRTYSPLDISPYNIHVRYSSYLCVCDVIVTPTTFGGSTVSFLPPFLSVSVNNRGQLWADFLEIWEMGRPDRGPEKS